VDRITNVASPNVTVTNNLPAALVSGDQLVVGQWHTICGSGVETVRSVVQDLNHWENCNGFLAQSARGVHINRPFIGNGVGRGVYAAFGVRQLKLDGPTATTGIEIPDNARMLHQGNDPAGGNQRNSVRNVCLDDWRTGAAANNAPTARIIQVDGGGTGSNPVSYNERFGGLPMLLGTWRQDNPVPTTQAATAMPGPHSAGGFGVPAIRYGAVTGIAIKSRVACSGGTATATLYKNNAVVNWTPPGGSSQPFAVALTNGLSHAEQEIENAGILYTPGDQLSVRLTTATFTPVANDIDVTVWVEQ
jgi:hypothetical protein